MIVKYGLIVENNKELSDFIDILNEMSLRQNLLVHIVCLAKIYQDHSQFNTIKKINFPYKILVVENIFQYSFTNLSTFNKIKLVLRSKYKIFNFIKDVNILLSGIQTVFERVLYSQIQKKELPIKTVVYHRHLLFDDGVNTRKTWKSISIFKEFLVLFGLEGLFLDVKAVGFTDFYIVLGEVNKKYLLSHGIPSSRVYPLGSLEFDSIDSTMFEREVSKDEVDKNIVKSKESVCYITGAFKWIHDEDGNNYQKEKLVEYCKYFQDKLDKYEVWIRIHPRESVDEYFKLKEKYPFVNFQLISDRPLLVDINKFDLLIGGMSTVLFEVGFLCKDVVFFLLDKEVYRYRKIIEDEKIEYVSYLSDNIIGSLNFDRDHKSDFRRNFISNISNNIKAKDRIVEFLEHL